jgi:LPXTG-site transpeptidase (sortase) family protein
VQDVFWSSRGAVPGARGNAYLFGHTYDSKPSGVGVLDHLKRLHRGQMVKITKPSKTLRYKVGKTEFLPLHPSEKKKAELLSHLGHSRLTLITCLWSKSKGKYVKLIVKHGKLVS